jgi:hypothetical protein
MSTVDQIEDAISKLAPAELAAFREWFAKFDAANWDEQIAHDAASDRLDALADEALADLRQGRCREL